MAAKDFKSDQPGLPSDIFVERSENKSENLIKGGFLNWYSNLFLKPTEVKKCQVDVDHVLKTHPALQLLIRAMESSGCHFNPKRHIAYEVCSSDRVYGAYDPKYNQVVICSNVLKNPDDVYTVLGYHLLQMFDSCRAHVDFRNIDHVACTEIRSNNLFPCGTFKEGHLRGFAPLVGYEGKQRESVRKEAISAVKTFMNVDEPTARAAVDRVFNRCYGDLEPFGQRIENAKVAEILYERRRNYGYY